MRLRESQGSGAEPLVLVVDDDNAVLRMIEFELSSQGFRVSSESSGEGAIRLAESQRPSLIVLDMLLPDLSGLQVMQRIRQVWNVPIILLTALKEHQLKVQSLDLGADDYVTKPFPPEELSARIRAVLRRQVSRSLEEADDVVSAGRLEINLTRRLVTKYGQPVHLTRTEWSLLQELASNAGRVLLFEHLLTAVWGQEYKQDLQYIRVWISRLRHKLEENPQQPQVIKTIGGVGYLLDSSEQFTEKGRVRGARIPG